MCLQHFLRRILFGEWIFVNKQKIFSSFYIFSILGFADGPLLRIATSQKQKNTKKTCNKIKLLYK